MKFVTKVIEKTIIPQRLKYKGKLYKIIYVDKKYIIPCYEVLLSDNKINSIYLKKSIHPNCRPDTAEFCIPLQIKDNPFNKQVQTIIENTLITFNLENAYFMPWGDVKYIPF